MNFNSQLKNISQTGSSFSISQGDQGRISGLHYFCLEVLADSLVVKIFVFCCRFWSLHLLIWDNDVPSSLFSVLSVLFLRRRGLLSMVLMPVMS